MGKQHAVIAVSTGSAELSQDGQCWCAGAILSVGLMRRLNRTQFESCVLSLKSTGTPQARHTMLFLTATLQWLQHEAAVQIKVPLFAMASTILPVVGLARSKQDPMNRGHGARYLYRPRQPGPAVAALTAACLQHAPCLLAGKVCDNTNFFLDE